MPPEPTTQTLDVNASHDALGDSSPSTEAQTQDANAGKSLQDHIKEGLAQRDAPLDDPEAVPSNVVELEKAEELSSTTELDQTGAEKAGEEEETATVDPEVAEAAKSEVVEGQAVPYERFKEVNERAKHSEAELEATKTDVTNYRTMVDFCQRNSISPSQFNGMLETLAALNNGEVDKAAPQIRGWYDQVQSITGDKLPADLQAMVDENKIDLDSARSWAKDRVKAQMVETKSRKTVEQIQQENNRTFAQQCDSASQQWLTTKMGLDPDYKPGTPKWEEADDRYQSLLNAKDTQGRYVNPVRSAQDMVALLERSYSDVNERVKKRNGNKLPTTKRLPSTASSGNNNNGTKFENAKTLAEAIKIGMHERGHK